MWKNGKRAENGAAVIEAALVIPIWVVAALSCIDLYFLSRTYSAVSLAAREAVITASVLPITGTNAPAYDGYFARYQQCIDSALAGAAPTPGCSSEIIAARVRLIIKSLANKIRIENEEDVRVEVALDGDRVKITVSATYRSIILKYLIGKLVSKTESGPAEIYKQLSSI